MNKALTVTIAIDLGSNILATLRDFPNREVTELSMLIDEAPADLSAKRRHGVISNHGCLNDEPRDLRASLSEHRGVTECVTTARFGPFDKVIHHAHGCPRWTFETPP